jgi:hypothetical protein
MTTKKKPVITHKKLSTNKACPKPFQHRRKEDVVVSSKPATILYKKLPDDMILITGFEGFLMADELEKKYGKLITETYAAYEYHIVKEFYSNGQESLEVVFNDEDRDGVCVNDVYGKHEFSKIIAHVKKCGGLLHDIIQAVNGGEVKRITI